MKKDRETRPTAEKKPKRAVPYKTLFYTLLLILIFVLGGGAGLFVGVRVADRQTGEAIAHNQTLTTQHLNSIQEQLSELSAKQWDMVSTQKTIIENVSLIDDAMLAYMTDEITAGLTSDKEQVMAVLTWVTQNIFQGENTNYSYATRSGLCGTRAEIAVRMLSCKNISAHTYVFYEFPDVTVTLVAIEAYFDGQWHFFDTMFGGYFEVEGTIWSWEQVIQDPQAAVDHMVVIEGSRDYDDTGSYSRANNEQRMKLHYSVDIIQSMRSYGVQNRETVIMAYSQLSMQDIPLALGEEDQDYTDVIVQNLELENMLSQMLVYAMSPVDSINNAQTEWLFTDCEPGQTYYVEYGYYNGVEYGTPFYATADGAEITSGATHETGEQILYGETMTWRIEFVAESDECSLRIAYDFTDMTLGASIDYIRIGTV